MSDIEAFREIATSSVGKASPNYNHRVTVDQHGRLAKSSDSYSDRLVAWRSGTTATTRMTASSAGRSGAMARVESASSRARIWARSRARSTTSSPAAHSAR